ncbi:MAG: hypothetical protein JWM93_3968 [Frankiales bacterium]|nr:hypothetical protein [Frankiales bacterium]
MRQLIAVLLTLAALMVTVNFVGHLDRSGKFDSLRSRVVFILGAPELGAVTLAEAAVLSEDDRSARIMAKFVVTSNLLDRIPFMKIDGNAYAYDIENALPGVAFRSVNEAYVESTGAFNQLTEKLVIFGGDADVDRFIQVTRSNLVDQRRAQEDLKVKAASFLFQDTFFNGDVAVNPKAFDGLKKRLVGTQVIDAGVNGIPVVGNGASDAQAFFDALDALLAAVPGLTPENGAVYANAAVLAKIKGAGRRIAGVETVREDMTGKRVISWQGIPILDPGLNLAQTNVLPQNETQGASNVASSIYAVKFGEDEVDAGVTGLYNSDDGDVVMVDNLGMLQEKPAIRTRVEVYGGVAVFGGKAAARLRGVLAA